jgi:hypothetical protein
MNVFFKGSRYEKTGSYTIALKDGTPVAVVKLPLPRPDSLLGFHRRHEGQRLDLIASHYLNDATTFWRLCDVNDAVVPDALATHDLIGIPRKSL